MICHALISRFKEYIYKQYSLRVVNDIKKCQLLSCVQLFATPRTVACQGPLSMGFSRQEYWSGLPFPSSGIFLTQGSNLGLLDFRQILYHLSHQGSPDSYRGQCKFRHHLKPRLPSRGLILTLCPQVSAEEAQGACSAHGCAVLSETLKVVSCQSY